MTHLETGGDVEQRPNEISAVVDAQPGEPGVPRAGRSYGSSIVASSLAQERELRGSVDMKPWRTALIGWRTRSRVDVVRFRSALENVTRRHEALRTHLALIDEAVVQVVHDAIPLPFRHVDLSTFAHREQAEHLDALVRDGLSYPFLLNKAPLWRCELVQSGSADFTLHLFVAHTIWDAVSSRVFRDELESAYHGDPAGSNALPPLEVQPGDVADWERSLRQPTDQAYWSRRLLTWPRPEVIPLERRQPADGTFGIGLEVLEELPASLARQLAELGRQAGGTLHTTLLAAFATLVNAWGGANRIPIGIADANRDLSATQNLIGNLINHLPTCVEVSADRTLMDVVRGASEEVFAVYAHKLPLRRVLDERGPHGRSSNSGSLWELTMNFRPYEQERRRATSRASLRLEQYRPRVEYRDHPVRAVSWDGRLDLNIDVLPGGALSGELTFDDTLVSDVIAKRLVRTYTEIVKLFVRAPDRRVQDLQLGLQAD